jgi:hypothetical protein
MAVQLTGPLAAIAQVEVETQALRTTLRPTDPGALGSYRKGMTSGTLPATPLVAAPVFSFRYGSANICIIRRVVITVGDLTVFTAGLTAFNLFAARLFTASDSGGTAGTLTGNVGKLRTSYATTGVSDFRISSTAALTPGTRTLDADPLDTISMSVAATLGAPPLPVLGEMLRAMPGEQPLVLAQNEGFVIQATVPAAGTWQLGVAVTWDELASW